MIDRDTIIDFVAAVDTEFLKREVGTYNGFDMYEMFAMYVEAKVRKEEREACIKFFEDNESEIFFGAQAAAALRAKGQALGGRDD
jgi:hypothetical protein